jgi:hypothetical protein
MHRLGVVILATGTAAFASAAAAQKSKTPDGITPALVNDIRTAAGKKLKDPYSAQFERMQRATKPNVKGQPTDVVCGYVNAKNSYGAYVGQRPFIYFVADKDFNISSGDAADRIVFPEMLKTFCTGLI